MRKKNAIKDILKNWKPISLLNVDTEILSKAILDKLKAVLATLISSQQTTNANNRFVGESGRLISDITDISDWFKILLKDQLSYAVNCVFLT